MASTAKAIDQAARARPLDDSLWWDSFVVLLDELEGTSVSARSSRSLAKKLKSNHSWFLGSLTCFKAPSTSSKEALNAPEISFAHNNLRVKPELREIALLVSASLGLDELQSYILVDRTVKLGSHMSDSRQLEMLHSVLIQYYLERQCLLKCVRWIFMHALYLESESHGSGYIREEAFSLVQDGLEKKFLSILDDLSQSALHQKTEVDLIKLWVEEALIESNLILDTFFLAYYENFCGCKEEQWKALCMLFKGMISGPHVGELAESSEAKNSFYHAKVQLALVLIETLNLENLLRMVHDDIPFRSSGTFSQADIQEMDAVILSMIPLESAEAGPLILSWGVFLYLLLSLPDKEDYELLMATDITGYIHNAMVYGSFVYLLEILQGDFVLNSDGPVSGYRSVLKTFISAFITCLEIPNQSEDNTSALILDILCKIYRGEESLCKQFWDRDSFIDKPIRSFLYLLEIEFPHNVLVVRLLSALCEGPWPTECVYNFLRYMTCITSLYEVPGGCQTLSSDMTVVALHKLHVEGFEMLAILSGVQGHVLKIFDESHALVRWKCGYSGIMVLLLRLAQEFRSNSYEDVSRILDLLYRMCQYNPRICFALMGINHSSAMQPAHANGDADTTSRIDLVKLVCSLGMQLVREGSCTELVSLCINILGEMLKCSPSYVVKVILQAKIFGGNCDSPPSGPWFLSGGLAKMVLTECEQNMKVCWLTMAVLDFTRQLLEIGADDDMVSSLVIFALHYVLVNHENWSYKFGYDRWKVTHKVFELVKSCIRALKGSSKLSLLIREILLSDSSVHNMLTRVICIKSQTLEELCKSRLCDSREVEGLQHCLCSALDSVSSILRDLLKDTSSDIPIFIQSLFTPTSKPVPVITATASLVCFFHNIDVQVSAARVLLHLCSVSPRVQQYSSENTFTVLEDIQLKELSTTIHEILSDEEMKSEELLASVMNLLTSAAYFQPAFLISVLSSLDGELHSSNPKELAIINPTNSSRPSLLGSLKQHLSRSESLFERTPRFLLCILYLLKALWKGNVQYMQILKEFKSSENFWEKLVFPVMDITNKSGPMDEILDDDDGIMRLSYRYWCEAAVLDIIACDIFLHKDTFQDDKVTNDVRALVTYDSSKALKPKDVLSTWQITTHLEICATLYSSSRFPEEIIHHAKMEAALCVVHIMGKLSCGEHGSLSLSLVQRVLSVSKKLNDHPAFSSLLQQYAARGYSEANEVNVLVLSDLYHHINGELEGRDSAPKPFKEVFQFLLEVDPFQKYQCKHDIDMRPYDDDNYMFDLMRLRKELGIELWEHTTWKTLKSQAERMLSLMHHANSLKLLAYSKNSSLGALTHLLTVYMRNVGESEPASFHGGIAEDYLQTSIEQLSQSIQATRDYLGPELGPSAESLKFLSTQVELLLSLFKLLSITSKRGQLLPICLLLIKTSDAALRLLSDARQSSILLKATKFSLTLLLTAVESFLHVEAEELDAGDDLYGDVSVLSLGVLPILCKYAENPALCNLSVAAVDLIIKGCPLTSTTWLPILRNHLHLQLIISNMRNKNSVPSVPIILRFFLTLARLKGGAEMLHGTNFFPSLKMLLSFFVNDPDDEDLSVIWGLGMAITESMISSLGDDAPRSELMADAIRYFYSEKASLMYVYLSFPRISGDDNPSKKPRTQNPRASLTALKETEHALMLTCRLAKHHRVWIREMREKDSELRERIIHMMAFISKSSHLQPWPVCLPILKEEACDQALHMYRIAFLLLEFLCIQARVAVRRAEEVGYIDLQFFPELPMPEILHGIQDQSISIVREICNAGVLSREIQLLCRLLLQILEKALYLELCVLQVCSIRPVLGRAEDFFKEIRLLTQAVDRCPLLKPSLDSLKQIIALVHPGVSEAKIS